MTITQKLDHAYAIGVIAFVSARDILIPIRCRADIREGNGCIEIMFADQWLPVRPELIKFVRPHGEG
ncbi:hypothetical protein [Bradyrhizobium lablabi]|uniref:hypothetical protein n=1 Tax=Bradyrhizobium lablabi TaxID=722472 RepID=UPI001BA5344E|nr:hypothetical protein [Bradyrhizobium lablabi]MBR0693637.1 hypothetical protein [Bradyrhizobium lablabi]